ncbi:MAG TPA: DUF4388 domain-containing protein [Pyrinomonadaceae bacterium]|nr:DUF4388 domain-containing protein [Pyrinomonadaceae bacterium]
MNTRFVVLTGHLDDYPLSDLIGILRHQQKTGRLLIEYPKAPGSFYFEDGELVDVQLDSLVGLQAICVAMAQPSAPFNFNPLIRPSQKSIDSSLRKVVSELFGCWDESPLQIDAVSIPCPASQFERMAIAEPPPPAAIRGGEVLALPPFIPSAARQNRTVLAMAAAGIFLLGLSSIIAVTGAFQGKVESVSLAASAEKAMPRSTENTAEARPVSGAEAPGSATVAIESPKAKETSAFLQQERRRDSRSVRNNEGARRVAEAPAASQPVKESEKNADTETPAKLQMVDVVMRIENGRVLQAAITNHKAGMDGYEALALRIARQRRYSPKANGKETVRIRVTQQD